MNDDGELYRVRIRHEASPDEVKAFCDLLEAYDYEAVTDLSAGSIKIHDGSDES